MRALTIVGLWLWAALAFGQPTAQVEVVRRDLAQPVSLAWSEAGRLAVLDLAGMHFGDSQRPGGEAVAPAGALALAAHGPDWWLADPPGGQLLRFNAAGLLQQTLPAKDLLPAPVESEAPPLPPQPVALALYRDTLYWADRANQRICRYDLLKQQALACFGRRGEMEGEFQYPYQMLFDRDGYLYVTDIVNARIQVFDADGRFFSQIGQFGSTARQLFRPNGIALDSERNLLFVSDSYFGTIKAFRAGQPLGELLDGSGQPVKLQSPTSLAWHAGKLYVADTQAGQVLALTVTVADPDTPVESNDSGVEPSQKNCLICHLSWAKQGNRPDKQGMLPEASAAMCYSCHNGAVLDSRARIGRGEQHASVYDPQARKDKRHKEERRDKLPDEFPRTADRDLPCTACHTPHTRGEGNDTLYQGHQNAWLRTPNQGGDMCERCHKSKIEHARETEPKKRGLNHPLALKLAAPPGQDAPGYAREQKLQHGLPDNLGRAGSALAHDQGLICQSCHQIHGGHGEQALTTLAEDKGQLCGSCHQRQFSASKDDARHKGIHPVNIKPDKPMKRHDREVKFVTCETCHKVHDGQLGTPLLEKEVKDIDAMCESCHQRQHARDKDDAKRKGVHPVNVKMDEAVEIAGLKTKEVKCLTCHSVHRGKADTPALVEDHKDGQLCSHCHAGRQGVVGSDHDLRLTAKQAANRFKELPSAGVCGSCHSLHRGENELPHLYAAKAVAEDKSDLQAEHSTLKADRLCLNCHQKNGLAEKKVVKHFSHPHRDLVLRSDPKRLPLLGKGEKVAEFGEIACMTCHEPHFWDADQLRQAERQPSSVKATGHSDNVEGSPVDSFLRSKGVKDTFCVECHGLEALTKFKYFHDKALARDDKDVDYLQ
jgi:predicted CXXCH cytochrome family protein